MLFDSANLKGIILREFLPYLLGSLAGLVHADNFVAVFIRDVKPGALFGTLHTVPPFLDSLKNYICLVFTHETVSGASDPA